MRQPCRTAIGLLAGLAGLSIMAAGVAGLRAQIAISANDAKAVLVDGVNVVPRNVGPDTVTVLDLSTWPPRVVADLRAPTSVIGPPESVAISADHSFALVTAATRIDPADPTKTAANDVVTVIDLRSFPPVVTATLHAGRGASGVSIDPRGTFALVANRLDGTISVFAISGRTVTPAGTVNLGAPDSGPSHVAIAPDGRRALVTRNNDSLISIVEMEGTHAAYRKQDFAGGLKPYAIEITPAGDFAVVGHIGAGATGGADTLALVDLRASPPRTIDQVAVGPTAEGLALSPDGRFAAVTVMDGTNSPPSSAFFHDHGRLRIFALQGRSLVPLTEAPVGRWCQGVAWSGDGRHLLVQCMVEQELQTFSFDGQQLRSGAPVKMSAAPAGIRVAGP